MKRIITYSLLSEAEDSDGYYADISAFTSRWAQQALPGLTEWVEGFRAERRLRHLPERTPESCAFDLLVIGVLLREHRDEINLLSGAGGAILNGLISFQER